MMRYLFLAVVLITNNPVEIAKINKMKKEAERAYLNGEYDLALAKYNWLTDSMNVEDAEVLLNRAHCYYHLNDSAAAKSNYQAVAANGAPNLKSLAYQQLGVMAKSPASLNESLQFFKAAVKENPNNLDARYDYEVVKKLIEQQEQQQQQTNSRIKTNKSRRKSRTIKSKKTKISNNLKTKTARKTKRSSSNKSRNQNRSRKGKSKSKSSRNKKLNNPKKSRSNSSNRTFAKSWKR